MNIRFLALAQQEAMTPSSGMAVRLKIKHKNFSTNWIVRSV